MFRFAHLSDLHLGPLPEAGWRALANKRVLSYLSWHRKRKYHHLPQIALLLREELLREMPDHLCITGDLANLGLAAEIESAAGWLRTLGPAERISLIPGNHDVFHKESATFIYEKWRDWMGPFPYVHKRGPAAFIGVSSAVATAPFLATGRVGEDQLRALEARLHALREEGLFRVVMIHHPPQPGIKARKALQDAAALRGVLQRAGAELVLHGHTHAAIRSRLPGPGGEEIPVLGAGSGSAGGNAHYHLITLEGEAGKWHWHAEDRRYDPAEGRFTRDLTGWSAQGKHGT